MAAHSLRYLAYGLNIDSELECPELFPRGDGAADVRVRFGWVPERLDSPKAEGVLYQVNPEQFLLRIERVGRFLVCNGNEVLVDRAPDACDEDIRVFLLGSVFGALLHQRGVLPLHASAIQTVKGAVAFAGRVGHGKSTLAAAFYQRGYRVLADDVCALWLDGDSRPMMMPAYPCLNLWPDALEKLTVPQENLHRSRMLLEKYGLPVAENFSTRPVPLCAVYELTMTNNHDWGVTDVKGREKITLIYRNTFRPHFLAGMGNFARYMRIMFAAARHIRATQVTRPRKPFLLDELADLVEQHISV